MNAKFDLNRKKNIIEALNFKGVQQSRLFECARNVRKEASKNIIEVRSVIEYSNICCQSCNYCGMNKGSGIKRYIMDPEGFLAQVDRLYGIGRRVIMIQTGEYKQGSLFKKLSILLEQAMKKHPDLSLICSFGNLSLDMYKKIREIGITRYLLKFETSDPDLYSKIKPSDSLKNRMRHIRTLKSLGFEVSSGNITGLPGQTMDSLADDLLLLKSLDIPMGSTSIFIPNNLSSYAKMPAGNFDITLNFMAILRIICPSMLIPTTSSLGLIRKNGQYLGFMSGANVATLHDGTPKSNEENFVIYKMGRYKPRNALFSAARKAGLKISFAPFPAKIR